MQRGFAQIFLVVLAFLFVLTILLGGSLLSISTKKPAPSQNSIISSPTKRTVQSGIRKSSKPTPTAPVAANQTYRSNHFTIDLPQGWQGSQSQLVGSGTVLYLRPKENVTALFPKILIEAVPNTTGLLEKRKADFAKLLPMQSTSTLVGNPTTTFRGTFPNAFNQRANTYVHAVYHVFKHNNTLYVVGYEYEMKPGESETFYTTVLSSIQFL